MNLNSNQAMHLGSMTSFFKLMEKWELSTEQGMKLLGANSPLQFKSWKEGSIENVSSEIVERISILIGIQKALAKMYPLSNLLAIRWLKSRQTIPGLTVETSPLDAMILGGATSMMAILNYLFTQLDK